MAEVVLLQPSVGDMDAVRSSPHLPLGLLSAMASGQRLQARLKNSKGYMRPSAGPCCPPMLAVHLIDTTIGLAQTHAGTGNPPSRTVRNTDKILYHCSGSRLGTP